jgi:hypothetical protein
MQKLSLVILLTAMMLSVSSQIFAQDAPGYTDGPMLPNSQWRVHDQARPQPKIVKPGTGDLGVTAPEDAIVLFDGSNLNAWQRTDGQPIGDGIADGAFDIMKTGQLRTKEEFGSFQLHLEWVTPKGPEDRMNWGNSGVFPMGLFEIQVIESCDSFIYADGNAGAIYGQFPPLVNPARKPGEWQSFDIFFTAPKFDGDKLQSPAYVTVVYNGVVVQNHQEILGTATHRTLPGPYPVQTKGPLMLQDHHSGVKFRNIWIRPIE